MRATEIAARLADQAEVVAKMLLPNGKRNGQEWKVGSVDGESGKSMGVRLTGPKAGVWLDGESGQSGDMIGLWMAVRRVSLHEACKEAMDYLGIREERVEHPRRQTYQRPTREGVSALSDVHRQWLTDTRKISDATIAAYKLATKGGFLMFPYLRDGQLIAAKYRKLPKQFMQDAGCEPCLFGWQVVPEDAREILICEGELDALAWHTCGVPALSVPMGGGTGAKHGWVETEYDRLAVYDRIYLSMDHDTAGKQATEDLVERLGRERTFVVTLPCKDANQCLMDGHEPAVLLQAKRSARTLDPAELRDIGEFRDEIWEEYNRIDQGIRLPWKKMDNELMLRPGETSIWAGINGHGKSTLASFVVGALAARGIRCCVASMEYRRGLWMMRMNRQVAGVPHPTQQYCYRVTDALSGNVLAFDVQGAAKAKRIQEVFLYARRRYGIEVFLLDNLTKCGFDDDDYSGQKAFVEYLTDFARVENTHVAIVAHMRKGESEDKQSGKFGVKGSGGVTDMVDTVCEVWRNKKKERARQVAERDGVELAEEVAAEPDTKLVVHKQRANGIEKTYGLWYDPETTQYLSGPAHKSRPLLRREALDGTGHEGAPFDNYSETEER